MDDGLGPELLDRDAKGLAWLWWSTLRQGAKLIDENDDRLGWSARRGAFGRLGSPIFIVGSPRSGTTYLGDLLGTIPDASYYFEPPLLKYLVRRLADGSIDTRAARVAWQLGLRSLLLAAPGSGPRIIEKNPNSLFVVEQVDRFFPEARFVILTRDGRDVAVSLREKPWHRADGAASGLREPGGYRFGPFPHFYIEPERHDEFRSTSDLHRCIWIWRRHQEEIERLRRGGAIAQHHIRYEDLVRHPEAELGALARFLGYTDAEFAPVLRAAAAGSTSSIGRWRASVTADDAEVFRAEAGAMLDALGYAD